MNYPESRSVQWERERDIGDVFSNTQLSFAIY